MSMHIRPSPQHQVQDKQETDSRIPPINTASSTTLPTYFPLQTSTESYSDHRIQHGHKHKYNPVPERCSPTIYSRPHQSVCRCLALVPPPLSHLGSCLNTPPVPHIHTIICKTQELGFATVHGTIVLPIRGLLPVEGRIGSRGGRTRALGSVEGSSVRLSCIA